MKELFENTKLFTILLAMFYIAGLFGYFFEKEILCAIVLFIILCIFVLYSNLGLKKALILFLIFILGFIRAKDSSKLPSVLDEIVSNDAQICGQIVSSKNISHKNNKIKFYFRADSADISYKKYENLNTKFLISANYTPSLEKEISIGDYACISGNLRHPHPSQNPHQFDYQKYLLNNDVKNILYAKTFQKTKEPDLKSDSWYFILKEFEKTRNKILEKHSKNIKSPNLEVLGGIVFGNETINPDEEIKESFKNSGLLHLLAASGLNVALIYGIWCSIANLVRFPYSLSILVGAFFVILYTFMTGFPPSILRASIMLLFVLLGKMIYKNANSVALVFFVGFLILLVSPKMLFDVGFELSFVVTIGLIALSPSVISKFEKINKQYREKYKNSPQLKKYIMYLLSPSNLAAIVTIPLIAQLCVVPLQMHYFNNLAPLSILANIAVVPFIGVLSFIGFISSIFALIPILNEPVTFIFDSIANPMLSLLINISEFFSSFKISLITTSGLNMCSIFSFWALFCLFILNLKNNFKNKKHVLILIFCLITFALSFAKIDKFENNLEIMMFDVENADCFLIKTPQNKFFMIDTGKKTYQSVSSAEIIINKYLKNERIKSLENLIVTHFDSDHASGVIEIIKNTKTKEITVQNENKDTKISADILKYLKENKLNYKIAKNDKEIYKEKDLTIKTYRADLKNDNESSIVTLITYKNKNYLFMADVGLEGYSKIKNYLPSNIEILKIGHHGAKNSLNDEMIKALSPKYALISAGYDKFEHPHYSTLEILNKNSTKTISTKDYGFIKAVIDDQKEDFYFYDSKLKSFQKINFEKVL